jgi:diguanylate cyclase (GGDEF)-like protein
MSEATGTLLRMGLGRAAIVGVGTAAIVTAAGGGDAFWLCVPGVVLLAATAATRAAAALGAAIVVVAAAAPASVASDLGPRPPLALALLVPAASAAVVLSMRERLDRDRDALRTSALTDPLTGVANRRSLLERIEYEISRHARMSHSFALVMLDLDGFKLLNDRFGHPAGDELLRDVASALTVAVRDQDTVARIGGDEFCLLAPETDARGAERLAARALQSVRRVTAGMEALGASAGTAAFPHDGDTAAALLHAADQRLLHAKRGRETVYRRAA